MTQATRTLARLLWATGTLAAACGTTPTKTTVGVPSVPKTAQVAQGDAGPPRIPVAPSPVEVESSVSTPTAPPPYDLIADRERIIAQAKEELGSGTMTAVVADVFVLIGAPGWNRSSLHASEQLVDRAVNAYLNGRFDRGPSRALAVYLFASKEPYSRYCRTWLHEECISPFGFYLAPDTQRAEGRMIMNAGPGLGTLTHELVHPFVDADFPTAPIWINEGIASLYEAPVIVGPGQIRGVKNWRLPLLFRSLASPAGRDNASLERLFGMSDEAFRDDREDLHYAMARYACQWLDERKLLWPFYRRWRDTFEKDPTGIHAFSDVTGAPPADANGPWMKWVRAL